MQKGKNIADIHPSSWQHYLFDNFEIKFIAVCSLKEGVGLPEVSKQLLSNVLENLQKWPEVDRKVPFQNSTGVEASLQSRKK